MCGKRGEVSSVLLLVALVVLCIGCFSADSRTDATLVVRNANVITVDASAPEATAFAVDGDRFVRVGGEAEVLELAGDAARVIDLGGRTVTPGFNDAHLHPVAIPPKAVYVGPPIVTVDGIVERLREAAAETPVGSWVLGWGYEDVDLGRHLDRHDLDAVSTDRPVMVIHGSLHVFAVNSRALVTAGVSAETPEPGGGGRFFRDENGEPTGLLTERPALEALFNEEQPSWRPRSLGDAQMQLRERLDQLYAEGVTSIGDALVPPELALVYWLLALRGEPMRVSLMIQSESLTFAKWLPRLDAVLGLFGYRPFDNERLRARTVKVFHGLSVSAHTARLYEPYAKPPGYRGLEPQRSQAELEALLREIHEAGLQMAVHTNGDYEIDMVLDAIEAILEDAPREDHRHRIEHGTVSTGSDPRADEGTGPRARAALLRLRERPPAGGLRGVALRASDPERGRLCSGHSRRGEFRLPGQQLQSDASHAEPRHPREPVRQGLRPEPAADGGPGAPQLHHGRCLRHLRGRPEGVDLSGQAR